jgi:hypothetical protein
LLVRQICSHFYTLGLFAEVKYDVDLCSLYSR